MDKYNVIISFDKIDTENKIFEYYTESALSRTDAMYRAIRQFEEIFFPYVEKIKSLQIDKKEFVITIPYCERANLGEWDVFTYVAHNTTEEDAKVQAMKKLKELRKPKVTGIEVVIEDNRDDYVK